MQFLNSEMINLLLYICGILALVIILIYTAFASEDVDEDDSNS